MTAEQYAQISAGTFEDLFIGDYWTIGNINYRIAAFDYWLNTGDTECTTHHIVLVPDTNLYTASMNNTAVTTGGYVGSKMSTSNLATAKSTINSAFGSTHILNHRELLTNSVSNGTADNSTWKDSTVELMNESMVIGCNILGNSLNETCIDNIQLPLFALSPDRRYSGTTWWLRCVASSTQFVILSRFGSVNSISAENTRGVSPVFAIIG